MLITGGLGIAGTRKEPSTSRNAFVSETLEDESRFYYFCIYLYFFQISSYFAH